MFAIRVFVGEPLREIAKPLRKCRRAGILASGDYAHEAGREAARKQGKRRGQTPAGFNDMGVDGLQRLTRLRVGELFPQFSQRVGDQDARREEHLHLLEEVDLLFPRDTEARERAKVATHGPNLFNEPAVTPEGRERFVHVRGVELVTMCSATVVEDRCFERGHDEFSGEDGARRADLARERAPQPARRGVRSTPGRWWPR